MSLDSQNKWRTADEIRFIDGIGAWGTERRVPVSRSEALDNYLEAAKHRANWDDLDRQAIIEHAMRLRGEY